MERKVIPIDLGNIRDSADARYAAKHFMESGLSFHGHVFTKHFRDGNLIHECDQGGNTFTTEGMNYLLDIIFGTTSKAGSAIWYVGIFKNNVSPAIGDTATAKLGAAGTYGECRMLIMIPRPPTNQLTRLRRRLPVRAPMRLRQPLSRLPRALPFTALSLEPARPRPTPPAS